MLTWLHLEKKSFLFLGFPFWGRGRGARESACPQPMTICAIFKSLKNPTVFDVPKNDCSVPCQLIYGFVLHSRGIFKVG